MLGVIVVGLVYHRASGPVGNRRFGLSTHCDVGDPVYWRLLEQLRGLAACNFLKIGELICKCSRATCEMHNVDAVDFYDDICTLHADSDIRKGHIVHARRRRRLNIEYDDDL